MLPAHPRFAARRPEGVDHRRRPMLPRSTRVLGDAVSVLLAVLAAGACSAGTKDVPADASGGAPQDGPAQGAATSAADGARGDAGDTGGRDGAAGAAGDAGARSEERRVGKECRSRWSP